MFCSSCETPTFRSCVWLVPLSTPGSRIITHLRSFFLLKCVFVPPKGSFYKCHSKKNPFSPSTPRLGCSPTPERPLRGTGNMKGLALV